MTPAEVDVKCEVEGPAVELLSRTEFLGIDEDWEATSDRDGEALIEAAGRQCYESWRKLNKKTADTSDYIMSLIEREHFSVLEHVDVAFRISKVSRVLTHQLVRHRHLSYSQRSQRYVDEGKSTVIVPRIIDADVELRSIFLESIRKSQESYRILQGKLQEKLSHIENRTARDKAANEAARYVIPNATETRLVVSGNLRAWRHFLHLRCSRHAGPEIRLLALEILRILVSEYPAVFRDFETKATEDGVTFAESGHREF